MRVRIDDPELLPDLLGVLAARVDAVVAQANERELEVGLLGSRAEQYATLELERRLDGFRADNPAAQVVVVDDGMASERSDPSGSD
jgi:hypothetical protein